MLIHPRLRDRAAASATSGQERRLAAIAIIESYHGRLWAAAKIISAPNPDLLLLPGMTAQLRIVVSDTGEILKILAQALRFRPNTAIRASGSAGANPSAASAVASSTVWVVGSDGRPNPVAVKLGASDDSGAALLDGPLTEGQQLIIGIANSQRQGDYFGIRLGFLGCFRWSRLSSFRNINCGFAG